MNSDAVIRPVADPEFNQTHYSSRIGSSKDICAFHGAYRTNKKDLSNKPICSRNSTLQRLTAKWNWVHISLDQTGIEFTNRVIPDYLAIKADTDLWALFDAFRLNHKDSGHETTWRTFSDHLEHASKWNQPNMSSHEGDIQFSSRVILNLPDLDIRGLIGGLRPNQRELSTQPNWSRLLTQHMNTENWIHINTGLDVKVIKFLNRRILDLPYLEPSGIERLQSYVWRPGDYLLHLEASEDVLIYTSTQGIRRISLYSYFPNRDAFTLGPFMCNGYFLFELSVEHELKTFEERNRLSKHGFILKISRYKRGTSTFHDWLNHHQSPTAISLGGNQLIYSSPLF